MKGILLISHGHFAGGLKESLEMLCGKCPQVFTACLESDDSPETFEKRLMQAYQNASEYGEVTVFCDLMGGTPCNVAVQKLMGTEQAVLISGMNLPMLLTCIYGDADKEILMQEGRNAISDVLAYISSSEDDCEE